jgi:hypothetical protein
MKTLYDSLAEELYNLSHPSFLDEAFAMAGLRNALTEISGISDRMHELVPLSRQLLDGIGVIDEIGRLNAMGFSSLQWTTHGVPGFPSLEERMGLQNIPGFPSFEERMRMQEEIEWREPIESQQGFHRGFGFDPSIDFLSSLSARTMPLLPAESDTVIESLIVQESEEFMAEIKSAIEELEADLAADQAIVVSCLSGYDVLQVEDVIVSRNGTVTVAGRDSGGSFRNLIAHFKTLQFTCKIVSVTPDVPKPKIGFLAD